jgi:molybdenum cofactor biosynthesis enzyme MoaA
VLPDDAISPSPRVVADGNFDFLTYLEFGTYLLKLRELVQAGGSLLFVRKKGLTDEFFPFRGDAFFRTDLPQIWEVDFAHSQLIEEGDFLIWEFCDRRPAEEADAARAKLPWRHLAHIFDFAGDNLRPPRYAWIPATFRCNLRCRTCSVRNSPPGQDMSDELIDAIFNAVGEHLEWVNVTGIGEPFFARTWPHLHRRIRERPYRWMDIVTNGLLLREDDVREMMKPENPTILLLSIDAARKETFEYIRDRAKWERLLEVIAMVRRIREEMKPGPHFVWGIDFVALRDNIAELLELIPMAAEWGMEFLIVIEMGDWVQNRDFFREQALRFYPQLANEYYRKARELAARYPFQLVSIPPDYTPEAVAAMHQVTETHDSARPGYFTRGVRLLANRLLSRRVGRKIFRSALLAVDWYLTHPIGLPRRTRSWLRQQVGMSRYETLGEFRRVHGFCEVVAERIYFHVDGDTALCCGMLEPRFGKFDPEKFHEHWNKPALRDFRLMNLLGYPHGACFYCTLPYGLPEKNPENLIATHKVPPNENRLAFFLRKLRRKLAD